MEFLFFQFSLRKIFSWENDISSGGDDLRDEKDNNSLLGAEYAIEKM